MRGQPGDRAAAPGQLALVQSFVNSVNREFGPDEFASAAGLATWLSRNGFGAWPAEPGELDRQDAVALREALRALLRENNGAPPDPQARAVLEHVARGCPLAAVFDRDTGRLGLRPAAADMRGVLAAVLAAAVGGVADGSWDRLKACSEPVCEWAFYDRSKNRGSRWCSMSVCGARAKMRNYRQAKREQG